MTTTPPITAAQLAATLATKLQADLADILHRMAKIDDVVADLRAAGIELDIQTNAGSLHCYSAGDPDGSVRLLVTNHAHASIVRPICEKHGGDWFEPTDSVLSVMCGISVFIYGVDHSEVEAE